MPYRCSHNVSQQCPADAHKKLHSFTAGVQELLGGDTGPVGRLCDVHRRIAQCSVCGACAARYSSGPRNREVTAGVDFWPEWRPLTAPAVATLARRSAALPTDHDQFHPNLTALICDGCRRSVTTLNKEAKEKTARTARLVATEAARKAAVDAAQRPDSGVGVGAGVGAGAEPPAARTRRAAGTAAACERTTRAPRARAQVRPACLVLCLRRAAWSHSFVPQTYETVREAAYALGIKLPRGTVRLAQFKSLPLDEARRCVDCIGHSWTAVRRQCRWVAKVDRTKGLASGTGADGESGFLAASNAQHKQIARNMLAKICEIEDKVALGERAVVACSHGSNRSFLIVNLYFQKTYDLNYEQVRQLMTEHRGGLDGPLHHVHLRDEPSEYLRPEFRHASRQNVALTTRCSHESRWLGGLQYVNLVAHAAVSRDDKIDSDDDQPDMRSSSSENESSSDESESDAEDCGLIRQLRSMAPSRKLRGRTVPIAVRPVSEAADSRQANDDTGRPPAPARVPRPKAAIVIDCRVDTRSVAMVCQEKDCHCVAHTQFMVPAAAAKPPAPRQAWEASGSGRGARGRGGRRGGRGSRGKQAARGCAKGGRSKKDVQDRYAAGKTWQDRYAANGRKAEAEQEAGPEAGPEAGAKAQAQAHGKEDFEEEKEDPGWGEPPAEPKAKKGKNVRISGILHMSKKMLASLVKSLRQIKGLWHVPAYFRQYKSGAATKSKAMRREADVYAEYYIARHRGDLAVCVVLLVPRVVGVHVRSADRALLCHGAAQGPRCGAGGGTRRAARSNERTARRQACRARRGQG